VKNLTIGCYSAARKNDFLIVIQFAFDCSNKLTLKELKGNKVKFSLNNLLDMMSILPLFRCLNGYFIFV